MNSKTLTKLKLPDQPGVYFFKQKEKILYIGKATSLRDRVRSYFASDLIVTRGPHILDMVTRATTVSYEETDTVLEALILEANLIKKHQPYYNTKEKDDKSFYFVCITKESVPKVLLVRGKDIDKKAKKIKDVTLQYIFGPYPSGSAIREGLKILRRIFPFIDEHSIKKDNYEFYRQLGLTPEISNAKEIKLSQVYKQNIQNIKLFFQGKKKKIITTLQKQMSGYAKRLAFERAGEIKRQLFALEHINDIALIKEDKNVFQKTGFRIEGYDVAHMSGKDMVGVMTVMIDGKADKNEYRKFIIRTQKASNDTGALEEVLSRRLRHTEWGLPDIVLTDGGIAQMRVAERVLKRYQLGIPVLSVVKDDRHKAREILGDEELIKKYKKALLIANSEAHRFAITFHKEKRSKSFLQK